MSKDLPEVDSQSEDVLDAEVIDADVLNYARPANASERDQEIWRDQKALVTSHEASLPHLCVRCNATADGSYRRRTFYWHSPGYFALLPFGIIPYALIALMVRKKAVVDVGLCRRHQKQQSVRIALAWVIGLLSIPCMIAGPMLDFYLHQTSLTAVGVLAGVALIIIGAVLGVTTGALKVRRINHRLAWFGGCGSAFLDQFSQLD